MNKTSIAWTDYTSNPIRARNIETGKTGHYCTHVTDACKNCYAGVWNRDRFGTGLDFLAQNASNVEMFLNEAELLEWSKPKYVGKRVFVCDMTDWMHELVTDEMITALLNAFARNPGVTFQLLTKRPERMQRLLSTLAHNSEVLRIPFWPLDNVWLGVTAGEQADADKFIPILSATPAAVRFVSYEPGLGPLKLWLQTATDEGWLLDWVIAGGESGAEARPFDAQWARSVRDQCARAGVAFFMKQMGGKRFPDDRLESLPEDLRVREFPR